MTINKFRSPRKKPGHLTLDETEDVSIHIQSDDDNDDEPYEYVYLDDGTLVQV
jgi:hypothetical protein